MAGKGFFKTLKSFSYAAAVAAAMMAAALFAGAAFVSCDNLGDGYDAPSVVAGGQNGGPSNGGTVAAPGAQTAGGQAAQVDECLTAYVSLPSLPTLSGNAPVPENVARYAGLSNDSAQSTDDISKSAFPNIADAADTAYSFEAELAIEGGATYTADGSYNGTTGKCSFSFAGAKSAEERTYTLTVSLYHTSGTPATKSLVASASQSVTVGAGDASFAASVQLAPNLDSAPNGSLSLPIKFSDTSVSSVKLMLLNSAGTDVTTTYLDGLSGTALNLTSGEGTIASKDGGLPAGTYTLLMTFMKGTAMVGSRTESLNIYPTMQTKLWWTKDGIGTAATALSVTQFDQKEFYVRGTGGVFYTTTFPGAESALDTNNGSFAFPLKTIQEAVNRITASGDTTSQFTVYIDGKIEGDPDADYSSNQSSLVRLGSTGVPFENKILIKGWTGPDTDIIDVKKSKDSVKPGRAFYIKSASSAKVIVKDLGITHSAASGVGGAFYIISCSDAILENCKISECYAATSGGGIYMSQSNLELKNSVVTQSEARSGGGVFVHGVGPTAKGCLTIEKSEISANSAASGGGVCVNNVYSTLNFLSGQIAANTATYSSTVTNSGLGGGIYINTSGKCFISGAATIGQSLASTSSCATSADGSHSNMATQGGGIYNKGELYLGYTDDSTPAAWTGSVCYNYASSDGGGILSYGSSTLVKMNAGSVAYNLCGDGSETTGGGGGVAVQNSSAFTMSGGTVSFNQTNNKVGGGIYVDSGATLTLNGTAEVSSNKTSPDGTGSMGGAGLFAYRASITMEGNAVVKDNLCKARGGGVYLYEFENASSYASLAMSGNAKILENTSSDGLGGAVYVTQRCSFSMSGAATIPAGVAGTAGAGKNDVYLDENTSVAVPAAITSTATPVAAITPNSYAVGTTVLEGSALSAAECAKFAVTQPSGAGIPWSIKFDNSSGTAKGVLKQSRSIIYVSADGDDGNDGTIDHPYATIQEAVKHFSDWTPSLGDMSDPGYPNFENKVYILSNMRFTDGAGADNNAYNFEVIACKDKTVGKNVTLTFDTPSGSGLYVAYGQKVKLTNIDITQSSATANKYAAIMVENNDSGKGELWMENCSVKNMTAKDCSAIAAKNDVHLKNVTVTGNTTKVELASATDTVYGPAVYSDKGTVHIEGTIVVKDNTVDFTVSGSSVTGSKIQNVWIGENTGSSPEFHKLDITGALTGSDIGVTLYDNSKTFTSYFNSSGSSDPADFFTSDDGWDVVLDESGNAKLGPATDLYVSASGNDTTGNGTSAYPYATIQKAAEKIEAFNSATTEYTIHVEGSLSAQSAMLDTSGIGANPISAKLTISGKGTSASVVPGGTTGSILSLYDLTMPIVIEKIRFTGGKGVSPGGGAICASECSDIAIKNCLFDDCQTTDDGGALYLNNIPKCLVEGSTFTGNKSTSTAATNGGGAIASSGTTKLNVKDSTFTKNSAKNGGAIFNSASIYIYGNTQIGQADNANTATANGGGVYTSNMTYFGYYRSDSGISTKTIWDGGVSYNEAGLYGGGIYQTDTDGSSVRLVLDKGSVDHNTAMAGAGLHLADYANARMDGGTITANETSGNGGAVYTSSNGQFYMAGGTITANSAANGGGIYNDGKCFVYNDAVIGDDSATDPAESDAGKHSNKATTNGGGIYNNSSLYLGYSYSVAGVDTPKSLTGGVYYNYAQSAGGGIYIANSKQLKMHDGFICKNLAGVGGGGVFAGGTVAMANGSIDGNVAPDGGAGVYVSSHGNFTMDDGSISDNTALAGNGFGGGIFDAGEFYMNGGLLSGNKSIEGGGVCVYNKFAITGGEISSNTAVNDGGAAYIWNDGSQLGTFEISGSPSIPYGTGNDVFLNNVMTIVGDLSGSSPNVTLKPQSYSTSMKVLDGTAALLEANHNKFAVTPQTVAGGGTKKWGVGSTGFLTELTTGGGSITIHTPEGDLNLAASATTITTSASDTTVTISATDASGSAITNGLAWNGVTVYYGADEIDTATGNSYKFKKTFPKGTYTLNVSVTYKGTTYSDSFTIKKTVDGAVAVAMPADFKKITAGSFKRAASSGAMAYTVTLTKDFYMCEHEVTQKEWFDLMGKTQADLINAVSGGVDKGTGDDYPVYYVNWYQAIAYCNKKSAAEGLTPCYTVSGVSDSDWRTLAFTSIPTSSDSAWDAASYNSAADGYRLPTDAEWEYAALGDYKDDPNWNGYGDSSNSTVKVFAGYNGSNSIDDYAWYRTPTGGTMHEVKGKTANSYDLYDMSGNVFEWCWDWSGNYDSADVTDPIGASGSSRVNRGGSWASSATGCSVNNQDNSLPFGRSNGIGFRVVRNAP